MNAATAENQYRMPLRDLLQGWVPAEVLPAQEVNGLQLDSRKVGAGNLYVALKGSADDGVRYIEDAVAKGAAAVLIEAENSDAVEAKVPVIGCPDLRANLGRIASRFFGIPSRQLFVVGITGTNGKTSCCQFIARALQQEGMRCGIIGTLGYGELDQLKDTGHTTPDAISVHRILAEFQAQGLSAVAMEVSSHGLEQARVAGVEFDVAVFTNLSRDHLDYHGDMASYGASKAKLFQMPGLQHAVINADDAFGREMCGRISRRIKLYRFALGEEPADVEVSNVEFSERGVRAYLRSPWGEGIIRSSLLGDFNLSNLLAVFTVLCLQGIPVQKALAAIAKLQTVDGRMQRFGGGKLPLVVVDYAHTPAALETALMTLRGICKGSLWSVFGCGGNRDEGKRELMGEAAERVADRVILTNDNPRQEQPESIIADILAGIDQSGQIQVELDRAQAIQSAVEQAAPSDIVLVAGKGHENYQEIGAVRIAFSDAEQVKQALNIKARCGDGGGR